MDECKSLEDLFKTRKVEVTNPRATERGELLKEFATRLDKFKLNGDPDIPYVAWRLQRIPTQDLYYIRSWCNDAIRTGAKKNFGHAFNSCLFLKLKKQ